MKKLWKMFALLIFTSLFLLSSCKENTKSDENAVLVCHVEELHLRKSGDPLNVSYRSISSGEKVIFLNEVSEEEATLLLNGKYYTTNFLFVEFPGGSQGWVFAAGVHPKNETESEKSARLTLGSEIPPEIVPMDDVPQAPAEEKTVRVSMTDISKQTLRETMFRITNGIFLTDLLENESNLTEVILEEGVYFVYDSIPIYNRNTFTLSGEGNVSILIDQYNAPVIDISNSCNVVLSNLQLGYDLSVDYNSVGVVSIDHSEGIVLSDLLIWSRGYEGATLSNSRDIRIQNCSFVGNQEAAVLLFGRNPQTVLADNRFWSNTNMAAVMEDTDYPQGLFSQSNDLSAWLSHSGSVEEEILIPENLNLTHTAYLTNLLLPLFSTPIDLDDTGWLEAEGEYLTLMDLATNVLEVKNSFREFYEVGDIVSNIFILSDDSVFIDESGNYWEHYHWILPDYNIAQFFAFLKKADVAYTPIGFKHWSGIPSENLSYSFHPEYGAPPVYEVNYSYRLGIDIEVEYEGQQCTLLYFVSEDLFGLSEFKLTQKDDGSLWIETFGEDYGG